MSNFLVIGSASAVFFGGAHRFMANPAKYPFIGNMKLWYEGKPMEWGLDSIKNFSGETGAGSGPNAASKILTSAKAFIDQLFSGEKGSGFGALTTLFSGAGKSVINNAIAKKTAGQIPYLQGLKAVLTGEPVGEWHVTVGNPLNPIAMIGNLICEGIDVEFNDELGPDDFPTEIKITVRLKHAMNRDKDAIESIFNRGMGRIYNLPNSFLGSADYQTSVDSATQNKVQTGTGPFTRVGFVMTNAAGQSGGNVNPAQLQGVQNSMNGAVSVWNKRAFNVGISENSNAQYSTNQLFKSYYRTADWIAQRAHS
jgi:hypothetical protein